MRFFRVARILLVGFALSSLGTRIPEAAPTRGFEVVSIRNRQGQQVGLYRASYALVIGVSGYADWPRLPGVMLDITAVVTLLQDQGFQVEQVLDPTLEDLRRAFDNFINKHGQAEDNRLLIYFAGHGHTLKPKYGGDMGYIVPVNTPNPQRDEAGFRARALSMQEIETYARRIQSKHVLFLFDSCFSGAIFSLSRAVPAYIDYKTSQPVRQFITSGQADEMVPDVSIFRQQLVAALQGEADKDGDGYVTGAELGEFLQQKVTNYSRNTQHPQYGKLRDPYLDKGDFVFMVAGNSPTPESLQSVSDLKAQVEAQRQQVQAERQRLEEEQRLREEQQKLQAEQERLRQDQAKLQGGGSPQGTQVALGTYPPQPQAPPSTTGGIQVPGWGYPRLPTPGEKTLCERLGGTPAISAIVESFAGKVLKDERINKKFAKSDANRLVTNLKGQIGAAAKCPGVKYTGKSMKASHKNMAVTEGEFNSLAEDLVKTLDEFKVPEKEKRDLLAAIGPMKKDIVEKPGDMTTGTDLSADFRPAPPLKRRVTSEKQ